MRKHLLVLLVVLLTSCENQISTPKVESVKLNMDSFTLVINKSEQLVATVTPNNAIEKSVSWSSSNPGVASVSETGLVTGITAGTAIVTVKTIDGNHTASCTVTVNPISITAVSLNKTTALVLIGNTEQLTATTAPSNATNKTVSWSSSNPGVASVSDTGLVTGITAGTAIVTVKTIDGNHTVSCTVTVNPISITTVSLNKTTALVLIGNTEQLTATTAPSNATNKTVSWSSSNPGVASVSETGLVTGITAGTAIVTVKTIDGNHTASCTVTVNPISITAVSLNKTTALVLIGNTEQLTATTAPSNATNKTVSWSSSNPGVASVSDTGLVTGITAGTAIVTVKTIDGNHTASCTVVIKDYVSISIRAPFSIYIGETPSIAVYGVRPSGVEEDITDKVTFKINDTEKALLTDTGIITPKTTGEIIISATFLKLTDSLTISIYPPVISSISIVHETVDGYVSGIGSVKNGQKIQLAIRANYTDGSSQIILDSISWSTVFSSQGGSIIVSVDSNGVLYANGWGSDFIEARYATKNTQSTVIVN